jgi:hypothetical protein
MGIRKSAPRKARQDAHVTLGPLRTSHKTALKKIWDERPCLPSITSRKAWARARGIDPTFVNRWFYVRVREARESGFELDIENESYDLDVEGGSLNTTPERHPILHSTTPEGLPELSYYEHSTASETGLRIPLSPGQSSSPIFGSSFYSPKLTLDSPTSAYGHLIDVERFIFAPPSPPRRSKTLPRTPSQRSVEELQIHIHQNMPSLPASPIPTNRLPPLPLAPQKPRPSRGSHDILDFRVQDDPCLWLSPHTLSPTPARLGYSASYHNSPRVQEEDDKLRASTSTDLRMIVAKTSRTGQKQGRCIRDDQSSNQTDNQATTSFHKFQFLWMISVQCSVTLNVCPSQLLTFRSSIKTRIEPIVRLPSQFKRRWLHRVHLRPTRAP